MNKIVKFSEIKDELLKNLDKKLKESPIPNEKGLSLIEGFMNFSLQGEISNNFVIGGPSIPVVGVVGNSSGRIYTFALKVLMPQLWETIK